MEQLHGTWGNRLKTFKWDSGLVTILWLEPGKRCSWHKHEKTFNQFTCIKGIVGIKTERGYTTILKEKQVFTVEPGDFHEFQTYEEPAVVEEIAYVKYEETDIYRKKIGGDLEKNDYKA